MGLAHRHPPDRHGKAYPAKAPQSTLMQKGYAMKNSLLDALKRLRLSGMARSMDLRQCS